MVTWQTAAKNRILSFADNMADKRNRFANFFHEENEKQKERQEPLSKVLRRLKSIFRHQHQLADANSAYYYMKYAFMTEKQAGKKWWQCNWSKFEWLGWGWPTDYGTGVWRVVSWSLIFCFLFALFYAWRGKLQRDVRLEDDRDFAIKLRTLVLPTAYHRTINEKPSGGE